MNKNKEKRVASGYRLIFGYLGIFLIIIGAIVLLPLILIPFMPLLTKVDNNLAINFLEGQNVLSSLDTFRELKWVPSFVIPGLSSIILGMILFFSLIYKREKARLGKHQDSLLLSMIWISAIVISSFPFYLRNYNFFTGVYDKQFSYIASLYESASGYCSIGLTIFKSASSKIITSPTLHPSWDGYYLYCFYRSILLFFGGVGLVLVVSSALSDRYGINLYQAEGHNDKLMPNLGRSAKLILGIYTGYIALGTLSLFLSGMSVFDAFNFSVSAISTGGFASRGESTAFFLMHNGEMCGGLWGCNAIAIEIVTVILMLLGSTNFITHYKLFKLKFGKAFNDSEVKLVVILALIFIPLITLSSYLKLQDLGTEISFYEVFRYSSYHFVSAISTTGLSNCTNAFSKAMDGSIMFGSTSVFLFIIIMFIGGGAGSTSGAVKQQRVVLSFKGLYWNVKEKFAPSRMKLPRLIKRHGETLPVKDSEIHEANSMILVYFLVLFINGTAACLILHGSGIQPHESFFEVMSALSSTGMSLESFNFIAASGTSIKESIVMGILILSMFVGRLEILPAIFGGYRFTRDILRKRTV